MKVLKKFKSFRNFVKHRTTKITSKYLDKIYEWVPVFIPIEFLTVTAPTKSKIFYNI